MPSGQSPEDHGKDEQPEVAFTDYLALFPEAPGVADGEAAGTNAEGQRTPERQAERTKNAIEQLVDEEFNEPGMFSAERKPWGSEHYFGVGNPIEYGEVDYDRNVLVRPEASWIALIYGSKLEVDPDTGEVTILTMRLSDLRKLHKRLAETVLRGERTHIATPMVPPEPEEKNKSFDNNQVWLERVGGDDEENEWPIMAEGAEDGIDLKSLGDLSAIDAETEDKIEFSSHDTGDYHTGVMALYPREGQNLIKWAGRIEHKLREEHGAGYILRPASAKILDLDPFAGGLRGESIYTVGIDKIDNFSDVDGYFDLLLFAMNSPVGATPEERLAVLTEERPPDEQGHDEQLSGLRDKWAVIKRQFGDVLNFITLYETRNQTTKENVDKAAARFLEGVGRVAHKIEGTYTGPDYE
jgi:hypothetical protein